MFNNDKQRILQLESQVQAMSAQLLHLNQLLINLATVVKGITETGQKLTETIERETTLQNRRIAKIEDIVKEATT